MNSTIKGLCAEDCEHSVMKNSASPSFKIRTDPQLVFYSSLIGYLITNDFSEGFTPQALYIILNKVSYEQSIENETPTEFLSVLNFNFSFTCIIHSPL